MPLVGDAPWCGLAYGVVEPVASEGEAYFAIVAQVFLSQPYFDSVGGAWMELACTIGLRLRRNDDIRIGPGW